VRPSRPIPASRFARFLEDVARQYGERVAVVSDDAVVTYATVEANVRELARALVGAGVVKARTSRSGWERPGVDHRGVRRSERRRGGGAVNTFASPAERDHILRHSDASVLLLQSGHGKRRFAEDLLGDHPHIASGLPGRLRLPAVAAAAARGVPRFFDEGSANGGLGRPARAGRDVPDALLDAVAAEVEPSDDALIIYTSGTTSQPKGVLQRSARPCSRATASPTCCASHRGPDLHHISILLDGGIAMSIGATFAAGARLLVQQIFEPGAALDMIERERATAIHAWAHLQKAIAEHPSAARRDLASVVKIDVHSPIAALAGVEKDLYNYGTSYGLSETFTICSGDSRRRAGRGASRQQRPSMPGNGAADRRSHDRRSGRRGRRGRDTVKA